MVPPPPRPAHLETRPPPPLRPLTISVGRVPSGQPGERASRSVREALHVRDSSKVRAQFPTARLASGGIEAVRVGAGEARPSQRLPLPSRHAPTGGPQAA